MALMDLLPDYYEKSVEIVNLQNVLQMLMDEMWSARNDLFLQLNVVNATKEWGLTKWEAALGLKIDVSKTEEYRRTRIMSKLRGQGTTTKSMIMNMAKSFSNGEVEVTEHSGGHSFDIQFVGTIGIPPNMDDLTAAVEEIKPAHLAYTFIYVYYTHSRLKPYTHAQLHGYTHYGLRNEGGL